MLASSGFPTEHWRQIWSNNPRGADQKQIHRRTDVVGLFPNRAAIVRLIGAVLAEQHDECAVARRYMTAEGLTEARLHAFDGDLEEVTKHELTQAM